MTSSTDPEVYTSLLQHFARYFDACDAKDLDAVMGIVEGATVIAGTTSTSDPEAIRAIYDTRQVAPLPDGRRQTKHHVTNLIVEDSDSGDEVTARVYYFRLQPSDSGPRVAASGRLEQVVIRAGTRWQVLSHSIISDF